MEAGLASRAGLDVPVWNEGDAGRLGQTPPALVARSLASASPPILLLPTLGLQRAARPWSRAPTRQRRVHWVPPVWTSWACSAVTHTSTCGLPRTPGGLTPFSPRPGRPFEMPSLVSARGQLCARTKGTSHSLL